LTVRRWNRSHCGGSKNPHPLLSTGKPGLKVDKTTGCIEIDAMTALENVPPEAWNYRLGHWSALE
jgi:hypothetical protein